MAVLLLEVQEMRRELPHLQPEEAVEEAVEEAGRGGAVRGGSEHQKVTNEINK